MYQLLLVIKSGFYFRIGTYSIKQANGHYISFLTSNEYVSYDFITMVQRGISTKSNLCNGEHFYKMMKIFSTHYMLTIDYPDFKSRRRCM